MPSVASAGRGDHNGSTDQNQLSPTATMGALMLKIRILLSDGTALDREVTTAEGKALHSAANYGYRDPQTGRYYSGDKIKRIEIVTAEGDQLLAKSWRWNLWAKIGSRGGLLSGSVAALVFTVARRCRV